MIIKEVNEEFYLEEITLDDIDDLRVWKNRNKKSFFYQNEISEKEQLLWFEKYTTNDEKMFMVVVDGVKVGCMGYRFVDSYVDVFNIMRGRESTSPTFKMSFAFKLMIEYIKTNHDKKVCCTVLNDNPAFQWYLNNGFFQVKNFGKHSLLEFC